MRGRTLATAFNIDDDSNDDAQQVLELSERRRRACEEKRTAYAEMVAERRLPLSTTASSKPSPVGRVSTQANAFEQLRRLAEWKRSCNGARVRMPEEMKMELAAIAERQGFPA